MNFFLLCIFSFCRIVFKVYDFQDLTLNLEGPIGHHSMAVRHLGLLGYKVMQVILKFEISFPTLSCHINAML